MEINKYASQLGFSSVGQSYRVLTIDNGSDLSGTDATGDFVEKSFENNQVVKHPFAKSFNGVIIANRAQVTSPGRQKSWMTSEFDPFSKEEIPIMKLQDGQIEKDAEGNTKIVARMPYQDLKKAKSSQNPDGSIDRNYIYFSILYVKMEDTDEIVKLKFKGGGRGNYIDYVKSIQKKGLEPFTIVTKFYTNIDPTSKKYAVFFTPVEENGQIKTIKDQKEIMEAMKTVLEDSKQRQAKLGGGVQPQISQQTQQEEIPVINQDEEEIKNEEIPF